MNKLSDWIKVCNTNEISDNQIFPFDHEGNKIMLVKKDGKIFALDRICTHAEADLSTGILSESGITCPLHLSVFNLENGAPQNPPAEKSLKTYNLKIEEDEIYLEVL